MIKKSLFLYLLIIFVLFFRPSVSLAEDDFLTLKQKLDRLQRDLNELSQLVYENPTNNKVKNNSEDQAINFASIGKPVFSVMEKESESQSQLMSRLTISALEKASKDSSCWKEPIVHKALLISGLSVLMAATQLLNADLN